MAIDFPNSPATNDIYTVGGKTWKFDGTAWKSDTMSGVANGYLPLTGGTIDGGASGTTTLGIANTYTPSLTTYFLELSGTENLMRWSTSGLISKEGYGGGYWIDLFRRAEGTPASPTDVTTSGATLSAITTQARVGGGYRGAAEIKVRTEGVPVSPDAPSTMAFSTGEIGNFGPMQRLLLDSTGRVLVGSNSNAVNDPRFTIEGTLGTPDATVTASITGTVMTVSAVSSGSIRVGDYVLSEATSNKVAPGTYILSFGTGTGGTGTYNLTTSQTVTSRTIYAHRPVRGATMRLRNTDGTADAGSELGNIEFWSSDGTAGASGVRAFVQAESQDVNGSTDLVLGTSAASVAGANEAARFGPAYVAFRTSGTEKMRIDTAGLITGAGSSLGAWTDWSGNESVTGFTPGNGVSTTYYARIGKVVHWRTRFQLGTTSSVGGVAFTTTIPVTALSLTLQQGSFVAWLYDTSASQYYAAIAKLISTTQVICYPFPGAGGITGFFSSTTPFTWASGDQVWISGTYEAA